MQTEYLDLQTLAYSIAKKVASELQIGVTEREAAGKLAQELKAHGIETFFHRPFAWFGDRSRFSGMRSYKDFLPSDQKLKNGDCFILDISPVRNGYMSDIGYSGSLGKSEHFAKLKACLLEIRRELPGWFNESQKGAHVWGECEKKIASHGLTNCHQKYPFAVLGHEIYRFSSSRFFQTFPPVSFFTWFPIASDLAFLRHGIWPSLLKQSTQKVRDGLWAIEPHLGLEGAGAKFEEILVIENQRARWLSEKPQWV